MTLEQAKLVFAHFWHGSSWGKFLTIMVDSGVIDFHKAKDWVSEKS